MADTETAPGDLGAQQSFLVLSGGTPAYLRSGATDPVATVEHVLTDDQEEIFQGLVLKTSDGHRYAPATDVEAIHERGVIITRPVDELSEPSEQTVRAAEGSPVADGLRRAWNWLVEPK